LSVFAQPDIYDKAPNSFIGHFNFMVYEDTSGKGNFVWTGRWYSGNFDLNTDKSKNMIAHWAFVEINYTRKDHIALYPWELNSYDPDSANGIRSISVDKDIMSFDLKSKTDKVDEEIHFYYNRKLKSISGSGFKHSEILASNAKVKVEFRQTGEINLPSNIVK
jgi:hypothetical protein